MISWVSGRHALEARLGHLIAVLAERGNDPGQLLAVLAGDGIAKARELIECQLMRPDRGVQPVVRDLQVKAAGGSTGHVGAEMLLVRTLIGRESKVAVEAENLDLVPWPQVLLELGEERFHRLPHLFLVDRSVSLEVGLAVVTLQAVKEL